MKRRRFLQRLGIGSGALGALAGSGLPAAAQQPAATPRRHAIDDWMDALPTGHRMVFDAVSPKGSEDVRHYASNFLAVNRSNYGLENRDIGVIIILRHNATPYAYNDAMWAKYGAAFGGDLKAGEAPKTNPAKTGVEGLDALSALGAHFGVCMMATLRFATLAAAKTSGGSAEAIFEELGQNLVRNAHLTPAGIVALGRAQERGFTFGYAG